jgi:catechol 2,3-dioxygenase-like lactoylglutathione lyase family enzyme
MLKIDGVTHWSIPVNDLAESERFCRDVLSPDEWEKGARFLHANGVPVHELIYREGGDFPGRELYFLDPSGNLLEIRDSTWKAGMPTPTFDEIVGAGS